MNLFFPKFKMTSYKQPKVVSIILNKWGLVNKFLKKYYPKDSQDCFHSVPKWSIHPSIKGPKVVSTNVSQVPKFSSQWHPSNVDLNFFQHFQWHPNFGHIHDKRMSNRMTLCVTRLGFPLLHQSINLLQKKLAQKGCFT